MRFDAFHTSELENGVQPRADELGLECDEDDGVAKMRVLLKVERRRSYTKIAEE